MKKLRNWCYEWFPAIVAVIGFAAIVFMVRPPA